jgi:hypothetical protein
MIGFDIKFGKERIIAACEGSTFCFFSGHVNDKVETNRFVVKGLVNNSKERLEWCFQHFTVGDEFVIKVVETDDFTDSIKRKQDDESSELEALLQSYLKLKAKLENKGLI